MGYLILFLFFILLLIGIGFNAVFSSSRKATGVVVDKVHPERSTVASKARSTDTPHNPPSNSSESVTEQLDAIERYITSIVPYLPEETEVIDNRVLTRMIEELELLCPMEYIAPERGWTVLPSDETRKNYLVVTCEGRVLKILYDWT